MTLADIPPSIPQPEDNVPDVSVVMGVFNAAARLRQTLKSVLEQEGCSLEFVVVDDGSTDGTSEILAEVAGTDARLVVIRQSNAGLTQALLKGCAAARAPFIARQDAGDMSLPGRLALQREALCADPTLAFVSSATEYVEPRGDFLYKSAAPAQAEVACDIIDLDREFGVIGGPSHHGAVMFRVASYREAGGYRPEFYFGQDWDLWYRLARTGRFRALQATHYRALVGANDISTAYRRPQEELAQLSLQALRLRESGLSDASVLHAARRIRPEKRGGRQRASGNYFIGECLRRNGNTLRAREYFAKAIRIEPWHLRSWLRLIQAMLASPGQPKA